MGNLSDMRNPDEANRRRDWSGLEFSTANGKITYPMDIDALNDFYADRQMVVIEAKCEDAPMPDGELWGHKHLVDALQRGGVDALCIVGEHPILASNEPIVFHMMRVRCMRYKQRWWYPPKELTVLDAYRLFRKPKAGDWPIGCMEFTWNERPEEG